MELNFQEIKKSKSNFKRIQTNLKIYGVKYPLSNDKIREKSIKTNLNKYGVKYPSSLKEVREKRYQTMKENHTFNTSKPEEKMYEDLCKIYGKENIKRQYKSNLYPWHCDFYIINTNKYIY